MDFCGNARMLDNAAIVEFDFEHSIALIETDRTNKTGVNFLSVHPASLQYVYRQKQQGVAGNEQPLVVAIGQCERGADIREMPERHEYADQRNNEDNKTEQTRFSTGRFHW